MAECEKSTTYTRPPDMDELSTMEQLRRHPDYYKQGMRRLGEKPEEIDDVLAVDQKWREAVREVELLRAERNRLQKIVTQQRLRKKAREETERCR